MLGMVVGIGRLSKGGRVVVGRDGNGCTGCGRVTGFGPEDKGGRVVGTGILGRVGMIDAGFSRVAIDAMFGIVGTAACNRLRAPRTTWWLEKRATIDRTRTEILENPFDRRMQDDIERQGNFLQFLRRGEDRVDTFYSMNL
ncbi:hypothetical protein MLD38_032163 [Melastoma candidum]|uniref:Uncharacterized protein n=1 Tax=Melastoma candidum TaxID=119954 RepID=A0ACB9M2Z2_9MYRT|nr:hypothetical protein MLD38_032163 [Melastoma candidum]